MPRIKITPRKTENSSDPDCVTKLIVAPHNAFIPSTGSSDVVQLRHPHFEKGTMFLFSPDNKQMYEGLQFKGETKTSWFVNDTVIEDGSLSYFAPYDPLFYVLPYLMKCSKEKRIMPLADALVDENFPETRRVLECDGLKYINCIAVRKGDEDLNAWAFDEEKTLKWLEKKVQQIQDGFKDGLHIKNKNNLPHKHLAFGALSDQLSPELASKLQKYLDIPEDYNADGCSSLKRRLSESNSVVNSSTPSAETKKTVAKENAAKKRKVAPVEKPTTGNRISNYFTQTNNKS